VPARRFGVRARCVCWFAWTTCRADRSARPQYRRADAESRSVARPRGCKRRRAGRRRSAATEKRIKNPSPTYAWAYSRDGPRLRARGPSQTRRWRLARRRSVSRWAARSRRLHLAEALRACGARRKTRSSTTYLARAPTTAISRESRARIAWPRRVRANRGRAGSAHHFHRGNLAVNFPREPGEFLREPCAVVARDDVVPTPARRRRCSRSCRSFSPVGPVRARQSGRRLHGPVDFDAPRLVARSSFAAGLQRAPESTSRPVDSSRIHSATPADSFRGNV
jgi:hypothetical protein